MATYTLGQVVDLLKEGEFAIPVVNGKLDFKNTLYYNPKNAHLSFYTTNYIAGMCNSEMLNKESQKYVILTSEILEKVGI